MAAHPDCCCPHCGSADRQVEHDRLQDRWFNVAGTWTMFRCRSCRVLFLDPRSLPADSVRLYADYYTHGATLRPAAPGSGGLGRLARTVHVMLQSLAPVGPRDPERDRMRHMVPGRLLDVGCGDGSFLQAMEQRGWQVTGVDPDPAAAAVAGARIKGGVHAGYLETLSLPAGWFRAITLRHVIEHTTRPVKLLSECLRLLEPRGRLVVVTPNADSLGHRCFGRSWRELDPPRHLRLFHAEALGALAAQAGFSAPAVRSTAARAELVARGSLQIRATGRYEEAHATRLIGLGAALFMMIEAAVVRLGAGLGEELVLVADKVDGCHESGGPECGSAVRHSPGGDVE
jgi:2-polyprenyl-3-methyl-5-hydroxy-6-metoxy-1,4-benzoquinol methylase